MESTRHAPSPGDRANPGLTRSTAPNKLNAERYFFVGISIWFLLIVFWGFSQTFFLKPDHVELALHLQVHGVLFSLWISLFVVQSSLIALHRIRIHMTLGIFGLVLLIALIPGGFYPVLYKVSIGTKTVDHGGYNLTLLTLGYIFVVLGLILRKKSYYHKRLMLFATLVFATAAVDRVSMSLGMEQSQIFRKSTTLFPAVALFVFDYIRTRSWHWFDLLPVLLFMGAFFLSDYFWLSAVGQGLMQQLVKLV